MTRRLLADGEDVAVCPEHDGHQAGAAGEFAAVLGEDLVPSVSPEPRSPSSRASRAAVTTSDVFVVLGASPRGGDATGDDD